MRLSPAQTLATLLRYPVVPVYFTADPAQAQAVVQACYDGGIRAFEFVNRGADALAVFGQLHEYGRRACPELALGIGTIYTADEAAQFIAAGADFVVQPVTTPAVGALCREQQVPWLPGALTPNEIYQASQLGAAIVKIFPGNLVGPDYIRALRGPMPHTRLMVTGGVEPTIASLTDWLGAGVQAVGMGSQLFKDADPAAITARVAPLMHYISTLAR
jgi:2-dehydro-3-deoxyphosphogluconate aldolase/(4S)-4-hydroxy-2-oxoglutarate aldolase